MRILLPLLSVFVISCNSTKTLSEKKLSKNLPIVINYLNKEFPSFGTVVQDSILLRGFKVITRQESFELIGKLGKEISQKVAKETPISKEDAISKANKYSRDIATIFVYNIFPSSNFTDRNIMYDSIIYTTYPLNTSEQKKIVFKTFKPKGVTQQEVIVELLNSTGFY